MAKKSCTMMWVDPEFKKKMHIERAEKGYQSIIEYTKSLSNKTIMFEQQTPETKKKYKNVKKEKKPFSFF